MSPASLTNLGSVDQGCVGLDSVGRCSAEKRRVNLLADREGLINENIRLGEESAVGFAKELEVPLGGVTISGCTSSDVRVDLVGVERFIRRGGIESHAIINCGFDRGSSVGGIFKGLGGGVAVGVDTSVRL